MTVIIIQWAAITVRKGEVNTALTTTFPTLGKELFPHIAIPRFSRENKMMYTSDALPPSTQRLLKFRGISPESTKISDLNVIKKRKKKLCIKTTPIHKDKMLWILFPAVLAARMCNGLILQSKSFLTPLEGALAITRKRGRWQICHPILFLEAILWYLWIVIIVSVNVFRRKFNLQNVSRYRLSASFRNLKYVQLLKTMLWKRKL